MDTKAQIKMHLILSVFWFFLPAGFANMAPSLFAKLNFLAVPVDFNKKLWGQPAIGSHKTYRGFFFGIIFAWIFVWLQRALYSHMKSFALVDYQTINLWELGFLLGFGALLGDTIKSFIKRRFKIKSGESWPPYDQLDWIIGAVLVTGFMVHFETKQVLTALLLFGALHPIVNLAGYKLKIKPNKF